MNAGAVPDGNTKTTKGMDQGDGETVAPHMPEAAGPFPALAGDPLVPTRASAGGVGTVGLGTVGLLVFATFGGAMALIAPMAFSLSLRLEVLAPGRVELLGYTIGIGSVFSLLASPLTGILSDRTRSRWGRRRPFTCAGLVLGIVATPVMAFATDPLILTAGWVLSTIGWGTALGSIGNYQADRLPPHQRGKISALTVLTMHVAPVAGILLIGLVSKDAFWVFGIPSLVGTICVASFIIFVKEGDNRDAGPLEPLSLRRFLASFVFNPRKEPDFAWTWLGRFVFFFGLSLTTSFSTFFYAQRLGIGVSMVASALAVISAASVLSAVFGSIGAGWLSDHWARRRPFIMVATVLFALGASLTAFAHDLVALVAGTLVSSLGIAIFSAVGQALVLDVLPHRQTQAGRFMAITSFAQKIPGALAPFAATLLLSLTSVGDEKNYTVLYLSAGMLALAGGLITLLTVKSVR
ncbi:MFS transporter [Pseudarthrobacter sp. NamE2]|uniref:MFS transporter n=1 Tax=Pseudarthrobacter sp. NamE2 TaxID=2576838 RepID=UPI0014856F5A|nr:MFS transporter [Pseudarthrobacter sp. NamE2]